MTRDRAGAPSYILSYISLADFPAAGVAGAERQPEWSPSFAKNIERYQRAHSLCTKIARIKHLFLLSVFSFSKSVHKRHEARQSASLTTAAEASRSWSAERV